MTVELLPCPFCGERLVKSEVFSTRSADHWVHPREGCVIDGVNIIISVRSDDAERVAAWNRRASTEMVEALTEAREYFASRADAEYFTDSAGPVGNAEMRLLVMVEAALAKAGAA